MTKKPYTPPTLTDHGSVVETTKGCFGYTYEPLGEEVRMDDVDGFAPEPKVKK
jgi:hypothetical protein